MSINSTMKSLNVTLKPRKQEWICLGKTFKGKVICDKEFCTATTIGRCPQNCLFHDIAPRSFIMWKEQE